MDEKKELVSQLQITICPLKEVDIEKLDVVLRQHVRDWETKDILENEIQDIKNYMQGQKDKEGRNRKYIVARTSDGRVLGCMGYTDPDIDMITHFSDIPPDDTVELVNAFVDSEVFRSGGVGRRLFEAICDIAGIQGKKFVTINSGPRYRDSWGFYDKMCDENRGFIIGKFGPGRDANTWLKKI